MITLMASSRFIAMKANYETKKKGKTMNPLTNLKKTRILTLLITPALVALATFTPVSARATASCGVITTNLLYPGARLVMQRVSAVWMGHQDEGERGFGHVYRPKHVSARDAQWVAYASGSQPDHRHIRSAHSLRGFGPHLYTYNLHSRPELHGYRLR